MKVPTPKEIKKARGKMKQSEAAMIVHVTDAAWSKWEKGRRPVNLAAWELFLIKTGKIELHPI